jgi:hypothetical protein
MEFCIFRVFIRIVYSDEEEEWEEEEEKWEEEAAIYLKTKKKVPFLYV